MNILIDLEPSLEEGIINLDIQFDKQVTNKLSDIDLSNQKKFKQIPKSNLSAEEWKALRVRS